MRQGVVLDTPDGPIGMVSYAATACSPACTRATSRSAPVAGGRVGYEGRIRRSDGPLPYRRQAGRHRRFCSWCLVATAATLAAVPLVVPDVRAAWRVLRTGRDR